jgi:hypothetical protein
MSYHYSAFISYRRNPGDEKFVKKFTAIIECMAEKVTNSPKAFLDDNSIKWGEKFDERIYDSIVKCYFFIPLYHNSYLHKDNTWCAKELYRAIEVEKRIRESTAADYCFILPVIDQGPPSDLPDCIVRKNALVMNKYKHLVLSNRPAKALDDLKNQIYDILLHNFKMLNEDVLFSELCNDIVIPSDQEIIEWIKKQKKMERISEANNLPVLR